MSKFEATIVRDPSSEKQTLGKFTLSIDGVSKFTCKTLELPWLNNARNISCIPTGTYEVVFRETGARKKHYSIKNVPGRTYVLVHTGNYYSDIRGCILVGSGYTDINADGILDVINSRKTLDKILALAPEGFTLTIK